MTSLEESQVNVQTCARWTRSRPSLRARFKRQHVCSYLVNSQNMPSLKVPSLVSEACKESETSLCRSLLTLIRILYSCSVLYSYPLSSFPISIQSPSTLLTRSSLIQSSSFDSKLSVLKTLEDVYAFPNENCPVNSCNIQRGKWNGESVSHSSACMKQSDSSKQVKIELNLRESLWPQVLLASISLVISDWSFFWTIIALSYRSHSRSCSCGTERRFESMRRHRFHLSTISLKKE